MNPTVHMVKGHLAFQTENLGQMKQIFPEMKTSVLDGKTYVAVQHSLDHAIVLRNLGFNAPSPIRMFYDWPGVYKPYDHQIHTAEFCTLNPRCFVLNGMGTGKTLSVLWASDYLKKLGRVHRTLIVSPLSTLERVWGDEIFRNLHERTFAVLHGSRQKRLDLLAKPHDYYIVNHDGLKIIQEELAKRTDIDLIIVDELASFRNANTEKWKVAKAVCTPSRLVWGLTGTPTPNAPTDAYGQSKLVKPENFNGHFTKFKMITMQQITNFKWVPRPNIEPLLNQVLKPSIRYALQDCIQLPPTIYHERHAELSSEQEKHFLEMKRFATTSVKGADINAVNAAVLVSKLLQAATGVIYDNAGGKVEVDFGPRLSVLEEAIEESEGKVIIFVPFTGILNALHDKLKKRWTCAIVDGEVSAGKRNQIFSQFQDTPNPRILLANPGTMAHGLTLTAATTIIWYAPIYSNEIYEQANARIARPGQKCKTNIVHIAGTALERGIYTVLKERGRLQSVVLGLAKEGR